jgi:nucleotide-binding universal stress UspA family protein
MQHFHNILFVSRGINDETEALKQALSLARNNNVSLKALIICPELPPEMADYKDNYATSLKDKLQQSIQTVRNLMNMNDTDVPIQIDTASVDTPAIHIIQHILRNGHDLVVKEAEPKVGGKGFKALDMELLQKCPCPVWLCRPIAQHRGDIRVAVAIDPESKEQVGHDLSVRLLALSRSLADACSGKLDIISCWDYEHENTLRSNAWVRLSEREVKEIVLDTQSRHKDLLEDIIRESNIGGKIQVHHLRGAAEQMIPTTIEDKQIDILVMGTVARTGISGFFIGNTAENVLQKLRCSLIALKPNGFVSPVKLY